MVRSAKINAFLAAGQTNVARGSYTAVPSDTADLPYPGVLVAVTSGTVSFVGSDGAADAWAVTAGQQVPVMVTRVNLTGTTAEVKVLVM